MRWIFRLLGVLILVAAFAVGAVFFLPKDRIAAIAADQVRAQTGRDLTVASEIGLSVWPVLGVRTGPVTFSNADWAGDAPMVEAEGLAIGIDARALLGGDIRIRNIEAVRPVVRLSTRADGTGNWEFGPAAGAASPAPGGGGKAVPVTLERLKISDARLIYVPAGGTAVDLPGVSLTLDWPEAGGPARFDGTLSLAGDPVTLSGRIDTFDAFLSGAVAPVAVRVGARGGEAGFSGRASLAGEAAGDLTLSAPDTSGFLSALGTGGVSLPRGLGQSIEAKGSLTFTTDRRLSLRALDLAFDGNRITGDADIDLSAKPQVTARLVAGRLDLSALSAGPSGGGAAPAPASGGGWSTDTIDASALGLADAQIALSAAAIVLDDVTIAEPQLALSIERARAVLQITRAGIFDGVVSGQLVANNRSGLSVGGALTARGIEAQSALSTLAGLTRLSGKAEAGIEFLGVGQSVDAIMTSLSGRGSLSMGRGVISGIDLDRLIRTGTGSGGTTVFDSMSADFTIERGDLRNDNLLILLANFRAEGAGRIGLGARDIDYLFTPIALRANSGQGLAIPIRITGPWSGPRIVPDLEQALKLDASGKVEEVKREAEERIERKLQEELGVTVQEGQSTEDAVKDALEEKAKDRLRRLLGGE
ncbi:MAG: AsmA family protein [Proteobacteria bacterium]|nr:AsmA family protein [Pseudomonadota bacterium]